MTYGGAALLIDDDPFVLKVLSRQLGQLGFNRVSAFERAHDVLSILREGADQPDLILTDLRMPEMDGVQFLRHLAASGYRGALLVISGEEQRVLRSVQELARTLGFDALAVLQKPATAFDIRSRLDTLSKNDHHYPPIALPSRAELRSALRSGQLETWFRPRVRLTDGSLVNVQAVPVWGHPDHGVVHADTILAMADSGDACFSLTLRLISAALQQCRRWQDEGIALGVSVDISRVDLLSLEFPEAVEAEAAHFGVPTSRLTLGVSESKLDAGGNTLEVLSRLCLMGVSLSVSDFGNGGASMARLRDFPFTELRLGADLVRPMGSDPANRAIVEATLGIARKFGLNTVADGLMQVEDWHHLRRLECGFAQGDVIASPMAAIELPAWAASWRKRYPEFVRDNGL